MIFFGTNGRNARTFIKERIRSKCGSILLELISDKTATVLMTVRDHEGRWLSCTCTHRLIDVFLLEIRSRHLLFLLTTIDWHWIADCCLLRLFCLSYCLMGTHLTLFLYYPIPFLRPHFDLLFFFSLSFLSESSFIFGSPFTIQLILILIEAKYFTLVLHEFFCKAAAGVQLSASIDKKGTFCLHLTDMAHDEILNELWSRHMELFDCCCPKSAHIDD